MRKGFLAASCIAIASLFLCSVVSAATETKTVCSSSNLVVSPTRITDPASFTSAVNGFTATTNLCTNEVIKLNVSLATLSGSLTDQITCICTSQAALQKVGCDKGQQQPTVTFDLSAHGGDCAKDTFTISKCVKNPEAAFKSVCTSGQSIAYVPPNSQPSAPVSGPSAPPPQNIGTEALAQTLSNFGVPAAQAQQIAQSNPSAANNLIAAFQSQDATQIQSAANAAGIQLNASTISNAVALTPQQVQQASAPVSQAQATTPDTTFAAGDAGGQRATQCGVQGIAGNIMYAESRCGANTYSATTNVVGPYQFLCPTWSQYANTTGYGAYSNCSYANDPNISAQVINTRYAMYQQQYGDQCTQAGLSWTSCAYAIHVFGENGFNNIFSAYQSDPTASSFSLCGSAVSSAACNNNASIFRNGGTVAGLFGELDSRLGVGTTVTTAYISPSGSPFAAVTGSSYPVGYPSNYSGSPFANVTPAPYSQALQAASAPAPQITTITPAQVAPTPSVGTLVSPSVPATPQAAATLLVQPSSVSRGASFLLTWSTVGMQSGSCAISMGTTTLANGEQGFRSLSTSSTTPSTLAFSLNCTALSGDTILRSATVSVH